METKPEYIVKDCLGTDAQQIEEWLNARHADGYTLSTAVTTGFQEGEVTELGPLLIMRHCPNSVGRIK